MIARVFEMTMKTPKDRRATFDWCRSLSFMTATVIVLCVVGCGGSSESDSQRASDKDPVIQRVTEKGPVKLTVRIHPVEPRLSDLVEMNVEVTAAQDVEITPPAFGKAVGDFVVRDYSEQSPQKSADDSSTTRVFRYQLEPVHTGIHLIRSVAIEFIDGRESSESKGKPSLIESDSIEINVTSELGDQVPDLADLEPMLPPQPIDGTARFWWCVIVLGAAIILTIMVWRWKKKSAPTEPVRVLTPEEIAHAALAQLLSENLPDKGLAKEFYVRLTSIVRVYIEGTTGLHAPEQTTEEFLSAMRTTDVFPPERSVRLREFLEASDMVKYAGLQPNNDQIDAAVLRAREFVQSKPG